MADLLAERRKTTSPTELEFIHRNKTAAMIEAAVVMGGACGGADNLSIANLRNAGRDLGMAFQIVDDILDATSDSATLGKTAGKDARTGKATYVAIHGLEAARTIAAEFTASTVLALGQLPGDTSFLVSLAEDLLKRLK
jgi:geranylgeranyl pyrophosphate synthase